MMDSPARQTAQRVALMAIIVGLFAAVCYQSAVIDRQRGMIAEITEANVELALRLESAEFAAVIAEEDAAALRERITELEKTVDAQAEAIEPSSFESAVAQGLLTYVGDFRRTWYSPDGYGIGTVGASGEALFEGAAAMSPADMERLGIAYGDEICMIRPDGSECWAVVLDASEASGIVDGYVLSDTDIPPHGTEMVKVYKKCQ